MADHRRDCNYVAARKRGQIKSCNCQALAIQSELDRLRRVASTYIAAILRALGYEGESDSQTSDEWGEELNVEVTRLREKLRIAEKVIRDALAFNDSAEQEGWEQSMISTDDVKIRDLWMRRMSYVALTLRIYKPDD